MHDVRLLSVKSKVFGKVCEEIFGAPGRSGEGLAITSATLARVLDEPREGVEDKRDVGKRHSLRRVLVKGFPSCDGRGGNAARSTGDGHCPQVAGVGRGELVCRYLQLDQSFGARLQVSLSLLPGVPQSSVRW